MLPLRFRPAAWNEMIQRSEAGYPREVCGVLVGTSTQTEIIVEDVAILSNMLEPQNAVRLKELASAGHIQLDPERMNRGGAFEFVIDPQEHCQALLKAAQKDWDQVGVFHSHPDHPAAPSATDAAQPMLAGWANIIVAIHGGKFLEAKAFWREDEKQTFQPQRIFVE